LGLLLTHKVVVIDDHRRSSTIIDDHRRSSTSDGQPVFLENVIMILILGDGSKMFPHHGTKPSHRSFFVVLALASPGLHHATPKIGQTSP
jgi:hypothetical protein